MQRRNKKTTNVENHNHTYIVDGRGNGRTSRECHPSNPNICHSHRIVNFRVEEAPSECYPNCTGTGAPGVGPHGHEINLGKEELLRQEQLRRKVTRFKQTPAIHMGRKKFVNKKRRLAAKTPGTPDTSNPSLPPINPGDSGIGDDLGFDDFNPDSGGSTNPGGNTGGGSGGSGGSGGNTGGGGY
tara:strand:+ start:419 stop:970 length:552 start_codon:yes stop_codon:yes gene_type:complete